MSFQLQLTVGWVQALKDPQFNPRQIQPLLQVIQVKQLSSTRNSETYRILLSDGVNCVPALPHRQLNTLLPSLTYSVIKLVEYHIHQLFVGRIITVARLEVICSLPHVLGSPSLIVLPLLGSPNHQTDSIASSPQTIDKAPPFQLSSSTMAYSSLGNDLSQLLPARSSNLVFSNANLSNLCDVTLVVGGARFFVSRAILASRSPYFRSLFLNGMRESQQSEILLHSDCDAKTFECILHWIYTDTLDLTPLELSISSSIDTSLQKAWKLWQASTYYCLNGLTRAVEEFISNFLLSPMNVCTFWKEIRSLEGTKSLQQRCKDYFIANLEAISKTDTFLTLPREILFDAFCSTTTTTTTTASSSSSSSSSSTTPQQQPLSLFSLCPSQLQNSPQQSQHRCTFTPEQRIALTRWLAVNEPFR
jgi:hypothetical protein